ncbi:class I SAM-dependent methyltransferase [Streptomyces sp. BHT-5-2]|uniref:class I SAM-dependent methyltransferase n=1 Tax=unclassified Streptomyces TaxID=2593676 RepID=UPI001C8E60E5|nr:class I SAM-dependent methyltransferase [Streptomyces sp. BHT-5-2]QZL05084.1 class I SAM-dependent methyltransferase [Streptomyces sp. BHT-5-2]
MPTISSAGGADPGQHRRVAESFGTDAARYDRARPRYPEALVRRIVADRPGLDVLDVGCGTGIAARQFQTAGCRVHGVEPDARMAEVARRYGTEVDIATFEDWDPAGRTFDAVVAATAWHWIDTAAGTAKAARALRPGGLLAMFWNVFQLPSDVAEAVTDVCRRALPDAPFDFSAMTKGTPDAYRPVLARAADGIRERDDFTEPEEWRFEWEWTYTRDAWLDQMPTFGAFTRVPPDQLTEVLTGVGSALDALGGSFTMHYTTAVVAARWNGTP